jgi:Prolyl 4-Hydroxylase alpha-subunit, N-terminal region
LNNPINAYLLVKRLTSDWRDVEKLMVNDIGEGTELTHNELIAFNTSAKVYSFSGDAPSLYLFHIMPRVLRSNILLRLKILVSTLWWIISVIFDESIKAHSKVLKYLYFLFHILIIGP